MPPEVSWKPEVERKFLVGFEKGGGFEPEKFFWVEQTYFVFPNAPETRLRKRIERQPNGSFDVRFFETRKTGTGLVREESETELRYEEFVSLFLGYSDACLEKHSVSKKRLLSGRWEIDVFGEDLVVAEIELSSADETFPPLPRGIGLVREVTGDARYANSGIAKYGPPPRD